MYVCLTYCSGPPHHLGSAPRRTRSQAQAPSLGFTSPSHMSSSLAVASKQKTLVQLWTRANGHLAVPPPFAPSLPARVAGSHSSACHAARATDLRDNGRDRASLV